MELPGPEAGTSISLSIGRHKMLAFSDNDHCGCCPLSSSRLSATLAISAVVSNNAAILSHCFVLSQQISVVSRILFLVVADVSQKAHPCIDHLDYIRNMARSEDS